MLGLVHPAERIPADLRWEMKALYAVIKNMAGKTLRGKNELVMFKSVTGRITDKGTVH